MHDLQSKTLPALDWHGRSDLSKLKGKKIHLRFRMARADNRPEVTMWRAQVSKGVD